MIVDRIGTASPFVWLGTTAGLLVGVSIVVHDYQYVDLWLFTIIYSVAGYALDRGLTRERYPRLRWITLSLSVVIYLVLFGFISFIARAQTSFPVPD